MNVDDLLNHPLAPVPDDGFTVSMMRNMQAQHRRLRLTMWSLLAVGTLPVLIALPLAEIGAILGAQAEHAATSPALSYAVGALVLLWVWKPRFFLR